MPQWGKAKSRPPRQVKTNSNVCACTTVCFLVIKTRPFVADSCSLTGYLISHVRSLGYSWPSRESPSPSWALQVPLRIRDRSESACGIQSRIQIGMWYAHPLPRRDHPVDPAPDWNERTEPSLSHSRMRRGWDPRDLR